MKRLLQTPPARLLLLPLLLLLACNRQDVEPDNYTLAYADYRPLLLTRAALESAVTALPAQAMHNTGKIYTYGNYVFINEKYEGLHVIDNRNPASPQPVSFLRIPGNVDLAVRNNILYADSGPDLVTFDLGNPAAPKPLGRVRDAFRELPMPVEGVLEDACQPANRPPSTVVVGWRKLAAGEAVPVKVPSFRSGPLFFNSGTSPLLSSASVGGNTTGKAGSLARFTILGQTLYTVDTQSLHLFDLQNPTEPVAGKVVPLGFGIETIFPRDHYLFLGSQTGMFIYDVATPDVPKYVSGISHARSCDPVVVDGNFAYVTLRSTVAGAASSGNTGFVGGWGRCGGSTQTDELDVIDISTINQPRLVRTYPMSGPLGLGAENGRLYVCDDGLKVFDTTKAPELTQLQQVRASLTDVIPNGDHLLGVGSGGLYQYSVTGPALRQVSLLPINPTE